SGSAEFYVTVSGRAPVGCVLRFWERVQLGACHGFGKRDRSQIWEARRVGGRGGMRLNRRWLYSGIATCPAEDSATCRCWTALRPDRRPSSTTPGPHDLPGDSPSTSDCTNDYGFSECVSVADVSDALLSAMA